MKSKKNMCISFLLALCFTVQIISPATLSAQIFPGDDVFNDEYNVLKDPKPGDTEYLYDWVGHWVKYIQWDWTSPTVTIEEENKFLRVNPNDRTEIIDGYGVPFLIKGMGVNRSYQLRSVLTDKAGESCFDTTEQTYRQLSAMGFNTVRFLMDTSYFQIKMQGEEITENTLFYINGGKEQINWNCKGLVWIRQNIEWAKKYNMKMILDMHSVFSDNGGNRVVFGDQSKIYRLCRTWQVIAEMVSTEPTVIGFDIMNEPILPMLTDNPNNITQDDINKTIKQWSDLADQIVSSIREKDTRHIIFQQRIQAITGDKGEDYYDIYYQNKDNLVLSDNNSVIDVHFYDPYHYSHVDTQRIEDSRYEQYGIHGHYNYKYPDESYAAYLNGKRSDALNMFETNGNGLTEIANPFLSATESFISNDGKQITSADKAYAEFIGPKTFTAMHLNDFTDGQTQQGGYKHYQSNLFRIDSQNVNLGSVTLLASNLGYDSNGNPNEAYFDNIVVKEYSANDYASADFKNKNKNAKGKIILLNKLDKQIAVYPYGGDSTVDNSKTMAYSENGGLQGTGAVKLIGPSMNQKNNFKVGENKEMEFITVFGSMDMIQFIPKKGCYYSIECDVKYTGNDKDVMLRPTLWFFRQKEVIGFNKEFLDKRIDEFQNNSGTRTINGTTYTNPVFMSEFGISTASFLDNNGGDRWADDMLRALKEAQGDRPIGFSYHFYNDIGFGLYTNSNQSAPQRNSYNKQLGDAFVKYLKKIDNTVVLKTGQKLSVTNGAVSDRGYTVNFNGTTMMPLNNLEYLCNSLGDTLKISPDGNEVTITNGETGGFLKFGIKAAASKKAYYYENAKAKPKQVNLKEAPQEDDTNKTYVPLRAVVEALGYHVYAQNTKVVNGKKSTDECYIIITTKPNDQYKKDPELTANLLKQFDGLTKS